MQKLGAIKSLNVSLTLAHRVLMSEANWSLKIFSGLVVCLGMASLALAQSTTALGSTDTTLPAENSEEKLQEAVKRMTRLRAEAELITQEIGRLALEGGIPATQEGVDLMRRLVDTLQSISDKLLTIEREVQELRRGAEPQRKSTPPKVADNSTLQRFRPTLYSQFQYRSSNRQVENPDPRTSFFGVPFSGVRENAFAYRRLRMGAEYAISPKVSTRISFDAATGIATDSLQMRDATVTYKFGESERFKGTHVVAGQFVPPLGFDLGRSSSEREMPERAQYNRVLMSGERVRGLMVRHPLTHNFVVSLGTSSSLTQNDPEQVTRASTPEGRVAIFGSLRYENDRVSAGISHFEGDRPSFRTAGSTGTATIGTVTVVTAPTRLSAPSLKRNLTYLDASWSGFLNPNLTVRIEAMRAHDRVPISNTQNAGGPSDTGRVDGDNATGFLFQAVYSPRKELQLIGRYESFDPDVNQNDDAITGIGGAIRYNFSPGSSLTLSVERFRVPQFSFRKTHTVYTWRYQVKF